MPRKPQYDREVAARVLNMRRGGVPFDTIAETLGLTPTSAKALFDKALGSHDPEFVRALEGDRLDRMHAAIWPDALAGHLDAIDRVVKISERREHVAVVPKENGHELRAAFDRSATTAQDLNPDMDAGLVEAGRKIADRVDEATATGEGQEVTKALYLIPHMLNVLREMQATPAARTAAEVARQVAENAKRPDDESEGRLAQLRAVRERRRSGA
jgi:hypothetical protein